MLTDCCKNFWSSPTKIGNPKTLPLVFYLRLSVAVRRWLPPFLVIDGTAVTERVVNVYHHHFRTNMNPLDFEVTRSNVKVMT